MDLMNKTIESWLDGYKINLSSVKCLESIYEAVSGIKTSLAPINEINKNFKDFAEIIKNDYFLQNQKVPSYLSGANHTLSEVLKNNELIDFSDFAKFFKQNKDYIFENYKSNIDNLSELIKKAELRNNNFMPLKSLSGLDEINSLDLCGTKLFEKLKDLELTAINELIKFFNYEGKLKGVVYYPGAGNDYNFSVNDVKLVAHDPFSNIKDNIEVINSNVTPENVLEKYDALIMKCALYGNEAETYKIYPKLVENLSSEGCVIEWRIGFHINPEELGLKLDPITKVIENISKFYNCSFYDSSHYDFNFKIWRKNK